MKIKVYIQLLMLFPMSLKLERAPEVKPEVPLKLTILSFWTLFDDIFKFKTKFWNRKYLPRTGSALEIHDFELKDTFLTTD